MPNALIREREEEREGGREGKSKGGGEEGKSEGGIERGRGGREEERHRNRWSREERVKESE